MYLSREFKITLFFFTFLQSCFVNFSFIFVFLFSLPLNLFLWSLSFKKITRYFQMAVFETENLKVIWGTTKERWLME